MSKYAVVLTVALLALVVASPVLANTPPRNASFVIEGESFNDVPDASPATTVVADEQAHNVSALKWTADQTVKATVKTDKRLCSLSIAYRGENGSPGFRVYIDGKRFFGIRNAASADYETVGGGTTGCWSAGRHTIKIETTVDPQQDEQLYVDWVSGSRR